MGEGNDEKAVYTSVDSLHLNLVRLEKYTFKIVSNDTIIQYINV